MKKIILSYTAINNYHQSPHSWLNKLLGAEVVATPAMTAGKDTHKLIQDHCLGITKDPRLQGFDWHFTKAEHHAMKPYNDKYTLHGYIDLIGYDNKVICEIKTGSPWSQQRFHDSMQWRYYSLVTGFKKVLMVTCKFDMSDFKTFYHDVTDKDIEKAQKWADEAIEGIESGRFRDDLKDGVCDGSCPYGQACLFIMGTRG